MKPLDFIKSIPFVILYYSGIASLIEKPLSKPSQFLILCHHRTSIPTNYSITKEQFIEEIKSQIFEANTELE